MRNTQLRSTMSGILLCILFLASCRRSDPYVETFDEPGNWRTGSDADVDGAVIDGTYDFLVKADELIIWTTAGENFADGVYEVEATQVSGPLDNGYGMLFRVDDENDNFYSFQISGDGYAWIGRYRNGGEEEALPLVGEGWIETSAVNQGLSVVNRLRVRAESGNMIFLVNDHEIGRVTDNSFASGDIGLLVRTLGLGGVRVRFDNFAVGPLRALE
jgi:hypothetical protein